MDRTTGQKLTRTGNIVKPLAVAEVSRGRRVLPGRHPSPPPRPPRFCFLSPSYNPYPLAPWLGFFLVFYGKFPSLSPVPSRLSAFTFPSCLLILFMTNPRTFFFAPNADTPTPTTVQPSLGLRVLPSPLHLPFRGLFSGSTQPSGCLALYASLFIADRTALRAGPAPATAAASSYCTKGLESGVLH